MLRNDEVDCVIGHQARLSAMVTVHGTRDPENPLAIVGPAFGETYKWYMIYSTNQVSMASQLGPFSDGDTAETNIATKREFPDVVSQYLRVRGRTVKSKAPGQSWELIGLCIGFICVMVVTNIANALCCDKKNDDDNDDDTKTRNQREDGEKSSAKMSAVEAIDVANPMHDKSDKSSRSLDLVTVKSPKDSKEEDMSDVTSLTDDGRA